MNDIFKSLTLIGIASVVIHSIWANKKVEEVDEDASVSENEIAYISENPRQEASSELDFSRKKRIYIKRQKNAYTQLQLLKGEKNIKEYHRKKPEKKTQKQDVKVKIGDKEFVHKVPMAVKKSKVTA